MQQHHLHDPDLIAAYSDGLLDDTNEAAQLVRECSDCQHEYELQQTVRGLLSDLPVVRMTLEERAGLEAAIVSVPTAKVISMADRRRVQRWMRVASVAAATFVLIGLGSVFLGMMGGSGGGASATTTAAAEEDAVAAEAAAPTAAGTTTIANMTGQTDSDYRMLAGGDADDLRAEIETMIGGSSTEMYDAAAARDNAICHEETEVEQVLDVARSNLDGRAVVIVIVERETGREAVIYDEATCELIELPPE